MTLADFETEWMIRRWIAVIQIAIGSAGVGFALGHLYGHLFFE
jgi:hypothetical protein